jgi:hypothetical protein
MNIPNDADFYERRARVERALAATAVLPEIRAIHLDMADNYALVARDTRAVAKMAPAR